MKEDTDVATEETHPSETKIILTLLITFLIIVAVTAVAYNRLHKPAAQLESYTFNGFTFVRAGVFWITQVQIENKLINIPLHYGPKELRHIDIAGQLNESFNYGPIYITFDPDAKNLSMLTLAAAELSLNLAQGIDRQLIAACATNTTDACTARPIINCENTDAAVIYLREGGTPYVKFDGNCIVVRGQDKELLKAVDQLLLYWYRIYKPTE
ncbi:MAG: hypothetical protein ABIG95_04840, partial [Candidatus Woesearchaeota archaeon]